jgi:serine/threonine protein kinase
MRGIFSFSLFANGKEKSMKKDEKQLTKKVLSDKNAENKKKRSRLSIELFKSAIGLGTKVITCFQLVHFLINVVVTKSTNTEPDNEDLFPTLSKKESNSTMLSQDDYENGSSCEDATEVDDRVYYMKNVVFPTDLLLPRGPLHIFTEDVPVGSMGDLKLGSFREKHKVAIKSYRLDEWNKESKLQVFDELTLLKYLSNYPSILTCYGYVINNHNVQIVYDLPPYGSLDQILREPKIGNFPLCLQINWMSDLADALQFLHCKGIIHGDIRTENIVLCERMEIKLCNFLSARSVLMEQQSNTSSSVSAAGGGGGQRNSVTASVLSGSVSGGIGRGGFANLHRCSFFNENSQKYLRVYQKDKNKFFDTAVEMLARKSITELVEENDTYSLQEKDKILADIMTANYSVQDYSYTSRLYNILLSILAPPSPLQAVTAKEIHNQLTALIEDAYEEDPRGILDSPECGSMTLSQIMKSNPQFETIAKLEHFIRTQTVHFYHFPDLPPGFGANHNNNNNSGANGNSNDRQAALKGLLSKVQQNGGGNGGSGSPRMMNGRGGAGNKNLFPRIETIVDHRQKLNDWLLNDCEAPTKAVAEDAACAMVQQGIYSPEALKQKLAINPTLFSSLKISDSNFIWNIRHHFER